MLRSVSSTFHFHLITAYMLYHWLYTLVYNRWLYQHKRQNCRSKYSFKYSRCPSNLQTIPQNCKIQILETVYWPTTICRLLSTPKTSFCLRHNTVNSPNYMAVPRIYITVHSFFLFLPTIPFAYLKHLLKSKHETRKSAPQSSPCHKFVKSTVRAALQ